MPPKLKTIEEIEREFQVFLDNTRSDVVPGSPPHSKQVFAFFRSAIESHDKERDALLVEGVKKMIQYHPHCGDGCSEDGSCETAARNEVLNDMLDLITKRNV